MRFLIGSFRIETRSFKLLSDHLRTLLVSTSQRVRRPLELCAFRISHTNLNVQHTEYLFTSSITSTALPLPLQQSNMPPHLHPRSTATSTLFAGTLLASFVVVGIPHLFPCPQPRRSYADAERRAQAGSCQNSGPEDLSRDGERKGLAQRKAMSEEAALFAELQREAEALDREARECPVPKPRGFIGRFLGFQEKAEADNKQTRENSSPGLPTPTLAIARSMPSNTVGTSQGKS